tara:strand:+ start:369 stop:749 length:381 start_codon:yes stop_codon:yes gene_type:complete
MPVQIKGVGSIDGLDQGLDVGIVTATSFVGTGVSVVGVITATSFVGSGANLTNVAGLGTALGTGSLSNVFYFDKTLTLTSNTTINPPASASSAYTHFTEVEVGDGVDLIIEDGDEFIIDVLGLLDS